MRNDIARDAHILSAPPPQPPVPFTLILSVHIYTIPHILMQGAELTKVLPSSMHSSIINYLLKKALFLVPERGEVKSCLGLIRGISAKNFLCYLFNIVNIHQ